MLRTMCSPTVHNILLYDGLLFLFLGTIQYSVIIIRFSIVWWQQTGHRSVSSGRDLFDVYNNGHLARTVQHLMYSMLCAHVHNIIPDAAAAA